MLQRWRLSACQRRLFCKAVALQAAAGSGYLDHPHCAAARRDTQSAGARLKEYHISLHTALQRSIIARSLQAKAVAHSLHRRLPRLPRRDAAYSRLPREDLDL